VSSKEFLFVRGTKNESHTGWEKYSLKNHVKLKIEKIIHKYSQQGNGFSSFRAERWADFQIEFWTRFERLGFFEFPGVWLGRREVF
jgi:hypothetical protein